MKLETSRAAAGEPVRPVAQHERCIAMAQVPSHRVACNLCQVDDATVIYPAGVAQLNEIVRCNRCGLMYASPRKDPDCVFIESWEDNPNWDPAKEDPQRFKKEHIQIRDYTETRAFLAGLYPQRGKLVEIGSSFGIQLDTFRQEGWDVLGIDPDRNRCRQATQRLNIPTIASTLEAAGLPDASADVVVMLHVIEHLPDPVATLREINRVLKPGGHMVLETPRYDTLLYKLLGRRERSLGCDGHIYFYTTDTLRRTYEAAGFELVQLNYVGRSLTLDRLAYNVGVITRNRSLQKKIGAASRRMGLQNIRFHLNFRDMQRICVRKTNS
jgi:2-polyprenyl-3-methyl-5-hydroxy-6-metoxy-1,4-benzoquinol methylase